MIINSCIFLGGTPVNYRHYEYDNPAAVSGRGSYITVVSGDDTLKRVRSLDTLLVSYRMTGEASCTKSGLGTNVLEAHALHSYDANRQAAIRLDADGDALANGTPYAVDDDTSISNGSGRIYITPEGDLRIYGNTNAYPILAGKVTVDVIW